MASHGYPPGLVLLPHQPASGLSKVYWTEAALGALKIVITPKLVVETFKDYWEYFAKGLVGHKKIYVPLDRDPNGCREGVLVGFFSKYSGLKDIHFAPSNVAIGKSLCHIDILLRDLASGDLLMSLEGVTISNERTDWFVLACLSLLLQGKHDIIVFLFGAEKVAQAVILAFNYGVAARIKHIAVLSPSGRSNHALVEKLQLQVKFRLDAVDDRKLLPEAKFVITVMNAGKPLFEMNKIAPNVVTLLMGIDELLADYFNYLLAVQGFIVVDDMDAMEARNIDTLALYYSRRDLKLTKHRRDNGVKNYFEILFDTALTEKLAYWDGSANFSAVDFASFNLAMAGRIYETLAVTLPRPG